MLASFILDCLYVYNPVVSYGKGLFMLLNELHLLTLTPLIFNQMQRILHLLVK